MINDELNTRLYQRMFNEQEQWKKWLLQQPPEVTKFNFWTKRKVQQTRMVTGFYNITFSGF